MHYYAMVALPPGTTNIEEEVARAMEPHEEWSKEGPNYEEDDDDYESGGFWDWWQIGGRWTGVLAEDYNPETDPDNLEFCDICKGTGLRMDAAGVELRATQPDYTCNGCNGLGMAVKWPTQWKAVPSDIVRLGDYRAVIAQHRPHTLVAAERAVHSENYVPDAPQGEKFVPTSDVEELLASLSDDCIVVVVDYHC